MQTLSEPYRAHLSGPTTTLALCWRIQRVDGVVLGFTQHDRAIALGGVVYTPAPAFSISAVERTMTAAVDNLDISGVFSSSTLTDEDLQAGRYDDARLTIFRLNWADVSMGEQHVASGLIGRVSRTDAGFVAELRGIKHLLQKQAAPVYSPSCRARLGDKACRVNLPAFQRRTQLTAQTGDTAFAFNDTGLADGSLSFGVLRWLEGPLSGQDSVILTHSGAAITLDEGITQALDFPVKVRVTAGCDKRLATCRDVFGNVLNYRGEPYVPGLDSLLNYPGLA